MENTRRAFLASTAAATSCGLLATSAAADTHYDVVSANGQTITIGQGDTYENKLIDLTTGGDFLIYITGGDSVVRNIGFKGLYRGGDFMISIVADSGDVLVENVYLGDGATKAGSDFVHGPGAVFYHRNAGCDVTFRHMNVQGYTNNGFYCSNTPYGGNVRFENCFGKNNGVSTFRVGDSGDVIENCVAYNDNTDYGGSYDTSWVEANGRPVWVWNGGEVSVRNSEFAAGPYPYAFVAGANGSPGRAHVDGGAIRGDIQRANGSTVTTSDVGSNPALEPPEGVPLSPEEAASGGGGGSGSTPSEPADDPWTEEYSVEHIYEVENTGNEPVEYYLQIEDGELDALDYGGATVEPDQMWSGEDKAAGRVAPGDTHCWGFNHLLVDVTVEPAEGADTRVNEGQSHLDRYPLEGADGDGWKNLDELLGNNKDDAPEEFLYEVEAHEDGVEYFLEAKEGADFTPQHESDAIYVSDDGTRAAGRLDAGERHGFTAYNVDAPAMLDVTIRGDGTGYIDGNESSLGWYPQEGASGDEWKDLDALLGENTDGSDEPDGSDGSDGSDEPDNRSWLENFLQALQRQGF